MKAIVLSLLTAICWSVGGYFEKKGLKLGNLSPVMGITLRTVIAFIVLSLASAPYWKTLSSVPSRALVYIIAGGGILAGSVGMLIFYAAISTGELSKVMPVAFGTSPVIGFLLGVFLMGEQASPVNLLGVLLVTLGVWCVSLK